jgi:hypothetical protein
MAERFLQCQSCKKVLQKGCSQAKRRRVEKRSRAGSLAGFKAKVGSQTRLRINRGSWEKGLAFTICTIANNM